MALGSTRSPPIALNECQKSLIQAQVLKIHNYPLGYEGPRFLISSARLLESLERVQSLIQAFEQPSPSCASHLETAVANWWHMVFGEGEQLPIRADDDRLPVFARMADGPSGFSRTRMPKSSDYLSWAAIGLDGSWLSMNNLPGISKNNLSIFILPKYLLNYIYIYFKYIKIIKLYIYILDDGWPESVEEQSLLLLVWRHYITR